ncbi:MAG: molybdopterin-dependent oxidoreductase [Methanotrichaceae archaeon]|nr:molybdopterin-dependent oxidoreductase [Methanotrichaceae archaeon]
MPSVTAALLTIILAIAPKRYHRFLSWIMLFLALFGFAGYISAGIFEFYPLSLHTIISWLGLATIIIATSNFFQAKLVSSNRKIMHCRLGYLAASMAVLALLTGSILLSGYANLAVEGHLIIEQQLSSRILPEVESQDYLGFRLTPLSEQGNNALQGTQFIDGSSFRLKVTGLVDKELDLSYDELLELPSYSEVVYMSCVEGWGFTAKWTGFRVTDLFNISGLKPEASYVIFRSADGYSTGLPLDYIRDKRILMAYGINDITLPPERGFPFQLVAKDRYGYKWAKWVTSIEVTDKEVRGYWESRGYSEKAVAGEFPFG